MSHRYLILGLLAFQPMTGYDIRKHVKDVPGAIISTSYGTLYPALHQLQKEGAVEMEEQPRKGRPARKVYRITPAGQRELNAWLQRPPESDKLKSDFLLRLYLSRHLPPHEILALLDNRRRETARALDALCHTHPARGNSHSWIQDYLFTMHHAEMDWLNRLESSLLAMPATTP